MDENISICEEKHTDEMLHINTLEQQILSLLTCRVLRPSKEDLGSLYCHLFRVSSVRNLSWGSQNMHWSERQMQGWALEVGCLPHRGQ